MHHQAIIELLSDYDSLHSFYRAVYKGSIGHSIGFRIGGEWEYGDSLPREPLSEVEEPVDAISVSSIVEGSDVEIDGNVLEGDFTKEDFWELCDDVAKQVEFYWERDNSDWYIVEGPRDRFGVSSCWGEIKWDMDPPPAVRAGAESMIKNDWREVTEGSGFIEPTIPGHDHDVSAEDALDIPGHPGWTIRAWVNDSTF